LKKRLKERKDRKRKRRGRGLIVSLTRRVKERGGGEGKG